MDKNKEKIDFKYNLSIFWEILSKYKVLFFVLIFVILLVEAASILENFLFKVFVDRATEFTSGILVKGAFVVILLMIAVIFLLSVGVRVVGRWLYIHIINRLDGNMMLDVKKKFFNHIIHLSHNFHTSHRTGSLISRLIRGGPSIERLMDSIVFNFAPMLLQFIIISFSLIYFDKISALIVLLTVLSFIGYSMFIQHVQQGANIKAINAEDYEKGYVSDVFTNIDSIKYFGKEDRIKRSFFNLGNKTKTALVYHWDYFRWLSSMQNLILGIGTLLLIYFPLMKFLDGRLTLGTLVFIYTVYAGLVGHLFGFVHGIRNFYRSMADFESLFKYGKVENEIKDLPDAKLVNIRNGEVEFRNVSFCYDERSIFKDFNLKINKDERIALVGHSGSGKTTLVKLLYRLYDPQEGEILIDGKDIKKFKQESLRSELSIVPQECVLFDDTIYNNIAFSRPGATKKQVFRAMKFAQLDKFVAKLPKKEKTIVGERGVKLSGGEKQRVSIARALLANKQILVLDEATSSLDSKTEHEIQRDLFKLMKGRTSIIIAHRLSTIMKADKIVVMEKGKIVQIGSHKDLIKYKGGIYRMLWELQKDGYLEE